MSYISKVLVGYSGAMLEYLIDKHLKEDSDLIILEDNNSKLDKLEEYNIKNLKNFSFQDGAKIISKSNNLFEVFISVSSTPLKRYKIRNLFNRENISFPNLFQKSTKVSKFAKYSYGSYLGDFVTIESDSILEKFLFINSHSHVGHNSKVGNYCIIGGSVTINGSCTVEDYCLIGSSVTIINGKKIGRGSVIQAGTCITQDIPEFSFVSNNPFKIFPVEILGKDYSISREI